MKRFLIALILLSGLFGQRFLNDSYGVGLDSLVNLTKVVHGIIGFQDSSVALAFTDVNWHHVTNPTNTLFTNLDTDFTTMSGDSLYLDEAGHYLILANFSYSGPATSEIWYIGVNCDGTLLNPYSERSTSTNAFSGNVGIITYVTAIGGEALTLQLKNTTQPGTATFNAAGLFAYRLNH